MVLRRPLTIPNENVQSLILLVLRVLEKHSSSLSGNCTTNTQFVHFCTSLSGMSALE